SQHRQVLPVIREVAEAGKEIDYHVEGAAPERKAAHVSPDQMRRSRQALPRARQERGRKIEADYVRAGLHQRRRMAARATGEIQHLLLRQGDDVGDELYRLPGVFFVAMGIKPKIFFTE